MNCNHMEEISIGIGTAVRERFHKMSLVSKLCLVQFKLCFPPKGGSTRIIAFGVLLIAFNVEESLRASRDLKGPEDSRVVLKQRKLRPRKNL